MAVAGIAIACPVVAQQARVPVIGMLVVSNPEPFRSVFLDGMRALGYVDGKTMRIEYRSAEGDADKLPALAAELVRMKVDVLVANQTPAVHAVAKATKTIPIAMQSGDPVATGLVTSLARPDGNLTGMSSTTADLGGKMLELLRELNPAIKRVGVLSNRNDPFTKPFLKLIEEPAKRIGIEVSTVGVAGPAEFESAYAVLLKSKIEAVIIQPSLPRRQAIDLSIKHRLPSISPSAPFADEGALLAYSANLADIYRALAGYVDRILKGAKPGDLPIQLPKTFELAVNQKTAKALGLTIPRSILARADRVIE